MIGPKEDDGVFGEAVLLELGKKVAGPGVHCGDDFVVAPPVLAHGWGVRIVWRQGGELGGVLSLRGRECFGNGLIFRSACDTGFVTSGEIEDGEKGLLRILAITPVPLFPRDIPGFFGRFELVVGF